MPCKQCFKCGETKDLSEFYKHAQMKDGHLNKCKACNKKDTHERRHNPETRESVLAYDRERGNRQTLEYLREYRQKYPMKYRAHQSVAKAVKSGKMKKENNCSSCDSEFHVEAHHDDYSFPLTVRWLCAACHKQWHSKNGPGKNF